MNRRFIFGIARAVSFITLLTSGNHEKRAGILYGFLSCRGKTTRYFNPLIESAVLNRHRKSAAVLQKRTLRPVLYVLFFLDFDVKLFGYRFLNTALFPYHHHQEPFECFQAPTGQIPEPWEQNDPRTARMRRYP